MAASKAKERIKKLRERIEHYRRQYAVFDISEISDAASDSLKHELSEIEKEYPELITPDSPTQRVAGGVKAELTKVRHKIKQWSLNDCFSPEEFLEFDTRVKKFLKVDSKMDIEYVCEHKIDGLKIVLQYKKGIL